MRDQLLDIVRAVSVVPFEVVKVVGKDGNVTLQSKLLDDSNNGSVIFRGKLSKTAPEFDGVFGLSGIHKLSSITNIESLREKDTKISIKYLERNGAKIAEEIVFEKADYGNVRYRLTSEKAIPAQMKEVSTINWNVEIEQPSKRKVAELAQTAAALSDQGGKFSVKTENRQLKFLIGEENAATDKAAFIFAENVQGTIKPNHTWNLGGILNALKLGSQGTTTLKISEQGILQIEVDTGIGVYTYMFAGSN